MLRQHIFGLIGPIHPLQGVRGQSGFFDLAPRERNIQVRLCLKVVLMWTF
jgi:hypothetical protein